MEWGKAKAQTVPPLYEECLVRTLLLHTMVVCFLIVTLVTKMVAIGTFKACTSISTLVATINRTFEHN